MNSQHRQVTPEQMGIPTAALLNMLKQLDSLHWVHNLAIRRWGNVVLQAHWRPFRPEIPHALFSLSKSFVSVAIGLAQSENLLNLDDLLIKFFPEYVPEIADDRLKQLTLRQCLTMASGHDHDIAVDMARTPDWVQSFFTLPLSYDPGSHFDYNSGATFMLAAVVKKVSGLNVREYLMPRLFAPLGMTPGIWECTPQGINCGGWGFYLPLDDIAKFAELLRLQGVWQGRQLIPKAYFEAATSFQIATPPEANPDWRCGYGYQFWQSRHGFRGDGANGQYAIVIPEKELSIAMNSGVPRMQRILDVLWQELLPQISDQELPPAKPEESQELQQLLSSLQVPVLAAEPGGLDFSGSWHVQKNVLDVQKLLVESSKNEVGCTVIYSRSQEQLRAGFGHYCYSIWQLDERAPHPVAASAQWNSPRLLTLEVLYLDSAYRDIYQLDFATGQLSRESFCPTLRQEFPQLNFGK